MQDVSRELRVQSKQRRGVLNWMMDRNLNLLINSAILVICYVQEGEQRMLLELGYSQLNGLAPVLTKKGSL